MSHVETSIRCIFGRSDTDALLRISSFTTRNKAFFADEELVAFVRPGLMIKIQSAQIASDGTISTVFTITDPKGAPLDREGIVTPGAVSTSFVAAYIPANQTQYVAYTTRSASGAVVASTQQASSDSGGTYTRLADGQYRYTFATKAPSGFPTTVTHTIGIYGNRNLSEFDLGTNYASTTFNFVPNGSAVTTVRDVIRTQSCNKCHDQLSRAWRIAARRRDVRPLPHAADPRSGHRQYGRLQSDDSQDPHGVPVAQRSGRERRTRSSGTRASVND